LYYVFQHSHDDDGWMMKNLFSNWKTIRSELEDCYHHSKHWFSHLKITQQLPLINQNFLLSSFSLNFSFYQSQQHSSCRINLRPFTFCEYFIFVTKKNSPKIFWNVSHPIYVEAAIEKFNLFINNKYLNEFSFITFQLKIWT
jgi:hypothetical protein